MNAWSNIQISPDDPEIISINNLENTLGTLPDNVLKIRELITRFEVCHFKYQQHIKKIKDSILYLRPNVDTSKIGLHHIQHGESSWEQDNTGRSLIGQQYIWALKVWSNDKEVSQFPEKYNKVLGQKIQKWLGTKNPEKLRLVRLLMARLTWDWEPYEKLQHGGEYKDIEFQACRMDICHYAFPKNLDILLQGIGQMKAVKENKFEGCGSCDHHIKSFLKTEFLNVNNMLKSLLVKGKSDKNELIRAWLIVCLAKTIKENIHLSLPIFEL